MMNRFPANYLTPMANPSAPRDPEEIRRQKLIEENERKEMAKQQMLAMKAQRQSELQVKYAKVAKLLDRQSPSFTGKELDSCKIKPMQHQLALAHRLREAETFIVQSELTNQILMTDPPGSGKTFAILYYLAMCKKLQTDRRTSATLIVVPPALVKQWTEAIKQFDADLKTVCLIEYGQIQELNYSNHHLRSNDIALTSTDMFPIIREMLNAKELGLHRVIVDEVDGVVDFQQIDCAPLNRPDVKFDTLALDQVAVKESHRSFNSKHIVPHVPATLIVRVSASMNVSEYQQSQFPVTVCKCQQSFIDESIHLEAPEYHTIRCPDIYVNKIMKEFLEPKEIKAMHALDFKSAVQRFHKRSNQSNQQRSIDSPVGVLKCLEGYFYHELKANEDILSEYTRKFPYLADFARGYGTDFRSLTCPHPQDNQQIIVNPNHTSRWTTYFSDLEYHVPLHVCEAYDDIQSTISEYITKNKHFRQRLVANHFCGGHCLRLLSTLDSYYKMPCCSLKTCIECMDDSSFVSKCLCCYDEIQSKNLHVVTNPSKKIKTATEPEMDKIDALLSILLSAKEEATPRKPLKVILATEFSQVFTCLEQILQPTGLKAAFLEAGSPEKTNDVVQRFMDPKSDLNIVFCQITTVGRGLNLPIASHVINFQRLEPKIRLQTIGRAQRLGRTSRLTVYDILHEDE